MQLQTHHCLPAIRSAHALLLAALLLPFCLTFSYADNVQLVGHIGGGNSPIQVQGSIACVAQGSDLGIFDVSNSALPVKVGLCQLLTTIHALAVGPNVAYVACQDGTLRSIDISHPSLPKIIGSYQLLEPPVAWALSGNFLYMVSEDSDSEELSIIDVSQPSALKVTGSLALDAYSASDLAVSGSLVCISHSMGPSGVFFICDVTNPKAPFLKSQFADNAWDDDLDEITIDHIAISGSLLYYSYIGENFILPPSEYFYGIKAVELDDPEPDNHPYFSFESPVTRLTSNNTKIYAVTGGMLTILDEDYQTAKSEYQDPDGIQGIAVSGTTVYLTNDNGLQVVDASLSPPLVGYCDTPGTANGVAVSGTTAYVADGQKGVQILDISNTASPKIIGTYDTPGTACAVALSGTILYVADGETGLQMLDVAKPSDPKFVGWCDTTGYAQGLAIAGTTAYVADGSSGLQIIDVSRPSKSKWKGVYNTPGNATAVAVAGTLAYVADGTSGLQIIDVTNSASPVLKGSYSAINTAVGVAISGHNLIVADQNHGLRLLDVSNPASPVEQEYTNDFNMTGVSIIGSLVYASYTAGVAVYDYDGDYLTKIGSHGYRDRANAVATDANGLAYVVNTTWGLKIFDGRNLAPVLKGACSQPRLSATDVCVSGGLSYLTTESGVQILDVNDPARPRIRRSLSLDYSNAVIVSGTRAYVAAGDGGLQIVDVSNPDAPFIKGTYDTDDALNLALSGSVVYVADGWGGLKIIDATDAAAPKLLGNLDQITACDVAVAGTFAYVVDGGKDLYIIDIADSASPKLVGTYDQLQAASSIAISGKNAYVADADLGLQVIDVSNPTAPRLIGSNYSIIEDGAPLSIAISGRWAYVTSETYVNDFPYSGYLNVLDVINPADPVVKGFSPFPLQYFQGRVTVDNGLAYVASDYGLYIFRYTGPGAAVSPAIWSR